MSLFNLVKILGSIALALQSAIIVFIYMPHTAGEAPVLSMSAASGLFTLLAILLPSLFVTEQRIKIPRYMLITSLSIMTFIILLANTTDNVARFTAAITCALVGAVTAWYLQRRALRS